MYYLIFIRKSCAALRNLLTSLPNPKPDPNPMLSGQVKSESEKTGSDRHHCLGPSTQIKSDTEFISKERRHLMTSTQGREIGNVGVSIFQEIHPCLKFCKNTGIGKSENKRHFFFSKS
jgi:hypothetical protein